MASSPCLSINWTKKVISNDNVRFLESLTLNEKLIEFNIELVHSTSNSPQDYVYVMNSQSLNYDLLSSIITFAGHTHKATAYLYTKHTRDVSASVFIPTDSFDKELMLAERKSDKMLEIFDVLFCKRYFL